MTDRIPEPLTLREAAQRVIEVVDEPSPQDDGTPEVEVGWYLRWEARHREAVDALRAALARQAAPDHEHYWVDAPDDETGWHCTTCGLTEYPGDPGIGQATPASGDQCIHDGPTHTDDGFVYCQTCGATLTVLDEATPASGGLDVETVGRTLIQFIGTDASDVDPEQFAEKYARLTSEATS